MYEVVEQAKNKQKKRGFTLIELVIVIVILGVLAGVAALSFGDVTKSSKEGVAKANARSIKSAVLVAQIDAAGVMPADENTISETSTLGKLLEKDTYTKPTGYTYSFKKDSATKGTVTVTDGDKFTYTVTVGK